MPKTAGERNSTQITTTVLLDDRELIERLMKKRGHQSLADVFKEVFGGLRTFFFLPPFMAELIKKDMEARDLDIIGYIQDLFGRRAQELLQKEEGRGKGGR